MDIIIFELTVFPGFLAPVLKHISFRSHRLLFSHASAEVRGENTPERKLASTGYRTYNHQVMSPTRSPLSYPGGAECFLEGSVSSKPKDVCNRFNSHPTESGQLNVHADI